MGFFDLFPPKLKIEKRKSSRLPFLRILVLSAALQCSHFLQFVRDSPVDEIGYDTYQVPVINKGTKISQITNFSCDFLIPNWGL